jgi:23S rRNA (guanosine2251-2'-O)-methyltransferase
VILDERNWMGVAGVVARSSAGASELMEMYVSKPTDAIEMMKSKGYRVICAGIRDSESLFETDLKKPLLVILGGEKRGISRSVLDLADQVVRIDYGTEFGGSLSTAAATAVFAFEILRYNR